MLRATLSAAKGWHVSLEVWEVQGMSQLKLVFQGPGEYPRHCTLQHLCSGAGRLDLGG